MKINSSRRNFLRGMAGLSMLGAGGCFSIGQPEQRKIRLAAVGVYGIGWSTFEPMIRSGLAELVAWCDCDEECRLQSIQTTRDMKNRKEVPWDWDYPLEKVPFYTDYRKLLDDAGLLGIEALVVCTPDHTHAPIAIQAMKLGIHVYVQKPLVRTLWELDYFKRTAQEYGVITQMGNQGSALPAVRRATEVIQSGLLGDVKEVHVWTNRPVWPQGKAAGELTKGPSDRIPKGFNWNAWLGPAAERPFKGAFPKDAKVFDPWTISPNVYHRFNWRAFFDFGCGAFGDMACHTMNMPFRALELGTLKSAELTMIEDRSEIAFPMKSVVKMTYAARPSAVQKENGKAKTLPECTLYWYDGGYGEAQPKPSADIMPQVIATLGKVPETGCFLLGTKGAVVMMDDYGAKCMLALKDEKKMVDLFQHPAASKDVIAQRIPNIGDGDGQRKKGPGAAAINAGGHSGEWLNAINGNGIVYEQTHSRCFSDIEFSIPMMEGVLVGCMAQRVGGKLAWDPKTQTFDRAEANALVKPYIRRGFEF